MDVLLMFVILSAVHVNGKSESIGFEQKFV